jgi:hypothetical protein
MPVKLHSELQIDCHADNVSSFQQLLLLKTSPNNFHCLTGSETRTPSPTDSQMSKIIANTLSLSSTVATSSDSTFSSKATERQFRAATALTGERLLCHFVSVLRRLIVFLVFRYWYSQRSEQRIPRNGFQVSMQTI